MKSAKAWIATCFLLAVSAAPAMAADWGGVKDMGGGVAIPVPAPVPVPTYDADSDWYVGLMLGGNISQSASIKDTDVDYLGDSTPGYFAKDSGDLPMSPIFGLTFGRYLTPSLRAEVAIDYTANYQISDDYRLGYEVTNSAPNTTIGGIDTNTYSVSRTDTVQLSRTTGLVNLIYDFNTGTRFTPYIGGGAGFSWRRLQRSYTESATCTGATNSVDGDYPSGTCSGNPSLPANSSNISGSTSKNQINLAAAVQAGVATNLTESIIWDNGWQMLWEQGAISSVAPSASGGNQIVYKDAVLQQFRSGLRIKFD
jgi:opacity protein-like surface antigen